MVAAGSRREMSLSDWLPTTEGSDLSQLLPHREGPIRGRQGLLGFQIAG